jgi:hypothetical protein
MATKMEIPESALKSVFSYSDFRRMVTDLWGRGLATGHEQKPSYLDYTKLNDHRMNRWDKHFQISVEMVQAVEEINQPRKWVLITEGWCGDSAQTAPAMAKIAAKNSLIDFCVALRDDHEELMQLFLTNGTRSIPILVCLNESGQVLWHWGPRPKGAQELISKAKQEGIETVVWKEKLHLWYAQNKQQDLQFELISLILSEH